MKGRTPSSDSSESSWRSNVKMEKRSGTFALTAIVRSWTDIFFARNLQVHLRRNSSVPPFPFTNRDCIARDTSRFNLSGTADVMSFILFSNGVMNNDGRAYDISKPLIRQYCIHFRIRFTSLHADRVLQRERNSCNFRKCITDCTREYM